MVTAGKTFKKASVKLVAKILKSIDELKYASFNQSPVLPECAYEKN